MPLQNQETEQKSPMSQNVVFLMRYLSGLTWLAHLLVQAWGGEGPSVIGPLLNPSPPIPVP